MALISISQEDLQMVTEAAVDALASGDIDAAVQLDILARKMDAALANLGRAMIARKQNEPMEALRWEDMESNLA